MKVFVSWSKPRSHAVACLLNDWLPLCNHHLEMFLSSQDLEKGALWDTQLSAELRETSCGILCLTRDNLTEPWINFEAGALFKGRSQNYICTLLIDIDDPVEVKPPLDKFNHTKPYRDDMLKLARTLHTASKSTLPWKLAEIQFAKLWPDFETGFKKCLKENPPVKKSAKRPPGEINLELLKIVRSLANDVAELKRKPNLRYWAPGEPDDGDADLRAGGPIFIKSRPVVNPFTLADWHKNMGEFPIDVPQYHAPPDD